jgi:hypothetical protein
MCMSIYVPAYLPGQYTCVRIGRPSLPCNHPGIPHNFDIQSGHPHNVTTCPCCYYTCVRRLPSATAGATLACRRHPPIEHAPKSHIWLDTWLLSTANCAPIEPLGASRRPFPLNTAATAVTKLADLQFCIPCASVCITNSSGVCGCKSFHVRQDTKPARKDSTNPCT